MRFFRLSALFLIPAALAQANSTSYLTTVLGALTWVSPPSLPSSTSDTDLCSAANLTSLVSVFGAIANTTEGMALLSQLPMGNHTVSTTH